MTAIGILKYHWKEGNPLLSWINPPEMIIAVMLIDSVIYIPVMLYLNNRLNRSGKYGYFPDMAVSGIGLIRMISGAWWILI